MLINDSGPQQSTTSRTPLEEQRPFKIQVSNLSQPSKSRMFSYDSDGGVVASTYLKNLRVMKPAYDNWVPLFKNMPQKSHCSSESKTKVSLKSPAISFPRRDHTQITSKYKIRWSQYIVIHAVHHTISRAGNLQLWSRWKHVRLQFDLWQQHNQRTMWTTTENTNSARTVYCLFPVCFLEVLELAGDFGCLW